MQKLPSKSGKINSFFDERLFLLKLFSTSFPSNRSNKLSSSFVDSNDLKLIGLHGKNCKVASSPLLLDIIVQKPTL